MRPQSLRVRVLDFLDREPHDLDTRDPAGGKMLYEGFRGFRVEGLGYVARGRRYIA